MDRCCDGDAIQQAARRSEQRSVLRLVLAINGSLFVAELIAGLFAHSTALLGDSLDMLGDSLVYGLSLYVVDRSEHARVRTALMKGAIMAGFGGFVIAEAVVKALHPVTPSSAAMGIVALAALAGNALCFWLLYRHRSDDLNMRSTWLCSRNDLVANLGVIGAALAVAQTGRAWPDTVVGLAIASLFLQTALGVIRDSTVRLRALRSVSIAGDSGHQPGDRGLSLDGPRRDGSSVGRWRPSWPNGLTVPPRAENDDCNPGDADARPK